VKYFKLHSWSWTFCGQLTQMESKHLNYSLIFPVFKLLRTQKHHMSHVCVIYSRICRWLIDFLKIRGPLCQCNVLGIYVSSVMQLKLMLVASCIWMGWSNLWISVILMWRVWRVARRLCYTSTHCQWTYWISALYVATVHQYYWWLSYIITLIFWNVFFLIFGTETRLIIYKLKGKFPVPCCV